MDTRRSWSSRCGRSPRWSSTSLAIAWPRPRSSRDSPGAQRSRRVGGGHRAGRRAGRRPHGRRSGACFRGGEFTAVVSAKPEESVALADRLGRLGEPRGRVSLGGQDLAGVPVAAVRSTVVVNDPEGDCSPGPCARNSGPGDRRRTRPWRPRSTSPQAGHPRLAPRRAGRSDRGEGARLLGRSAAADQARQALAADPPVLVLLEPTSAVDAHGGASARHSPRRGAAGRPSSRR